MTATKEVTSVKRPIYRLERSVSDSSTLADMPSAFFKPKIVESQPDKSTAIVQKKVDPDDEWISGDDYPQFVNHDETWKTITASDLKRCTIPFSDNANVAVVEGGRRVMPRVIPLSPPWTEERLARVREKVQILHKAVAEGRAELRIVRGTTLFTECACLSDEEDS